MRILTAIIAISQALAISPALAAYPERPIRLIVPFGVGGPGDILSRVVGEGLSKRMGQPVIIDTKPGASTIVGSRLAAAAPADGYTLMTISTTHAVNPALYKNLPYDPIKDFVPVTLMAETPFILCINPKVEANSVQELIDYAKRNPKALAYGSSGTGSSIHLTAELFKNQAGINMLHVPYKGSGPAFTDLIGGQVQMVFSSSVSSLPHMKNGVVRALAVTSLKRNSALPDLPTLAESGFPGFESTSWFGIVAPGKTPADIVSKLQTEIAAVLKTDEVSKVLEELGADPGGMSPEEFSKFFRNEMDKWGKVVSDAKITVEQ